MSPEELEQYKKLLSAAYPFEKGKIRDSVMAKIAAEPQKKNKTPWRQLAIRWGSIAAALLFVCIIGINLMPKLGVLEKSDAFAEADEAAVENSPVEKSEDADSTTEAPESYTPPADDSYNEGIALALTAIAEDEAFDIDAEAGGSAESADDSFSSEDWGENSDGESDLQVAYSMRTLTAFSTTPIVCTITECAHSEAFMNSYHDIPMLFVNLVGAENYADWESGLADESSKNIVEFIEEFGISRELFCELVETTDLYYTRDYPIDLIYSDDNTSAEEYYSRGGDMDGSLARYFEYKFKTALGAASENYNSWRSMRGFSSASEWSIAHLVRDLDVEREDLEAIYNATAERFLEIYEGAKIPTYDFDAIMECGSDIRRAITSGALGHEVDSIYRK